MKRKAQSLSLRARASAILIVLCVSFLAFNMIRSSQASPVSWLSGFGFRKSHVINPASGAGSNYQVKINVNNGFGTDNANTVYVNSKCRSDFGDLRFTESDGTTPLNYGCRTRYFQT